MKTKTILTVLAMSILSVGLFKIYKSKFWEKEKLTKAKAVEIIIKSGNSKNENNSLFKFEEPFVIAWANSALKKTTTFDYNGKKYNVKGGLSVK